MRAITFVPAQPLLTTTLNEPLVTVNKVGSGKVVFVAVPDLLGEDERMVPLAAHVLAHLAADAAPVKVEGDVEYLVNRNSRGWVVTIFNDSGVFKPQQGLAQVDRSGMNRDGPDRDGILRKCDTASDSAHQDSKDRDSDFVIVSCFDIRISSFFFRNVFD